MYLAKSVLIPLKLKAAASAAKTKQNKTKTTTITKKNKNKQTKKTTFAYGTIIQITPNEEMQDIMEIIKSLEDLGIFLKVCQ